MQIMRIIEVKTLSNGAHRNYRGTIAKVPEGWAKVPDDMETPNFPFGEIKVEEIDGVMTVTKWVAGTIPEKPKEKAPITQEERIAALEAAILEMT